MPEKHVQKMIDAARKEIRENAYSKKNFLILNICGSAELLSEICKLTHLTRLELNNVPEILPQITQLNNLIELDLSYSPDLTAIPPYIQELEKLQRLQIKNTSIKNLPDELVSMSTLNMLAVCDNYSLNYIPEQIGKLKNLDWLRLDGNRPYNGLTKGVELFLPASIGELSNLKKLHLDTNNLVDLPSSFEGLKNLTELSINFNFFSDLPEVVYKLTSLQVLGLLGLPIKELPPKIKALKNLRSLDVNTALIQNIPKSVVALGTPAVIQYFTHGQIPVKRKSKFPANVGETKESLERFETFFENIHDEESYSPDDEGLAELEHFILSGADEVPFAEVYLYEDVKKLPELLAPFSRWSAIDHRVVEYITQRLWCFDEGYSGYFVSFYKWLSSELIRNKAATDLFESVLEHLKLYGLDELEQLPERQYKLLDCVTHDHELTSLGHHLLKHAESILPRLVEHGITAKFLEPFATHKFDLLMPHLQKITCVDEYKGADGNRHIGIGTLSVLAKYNAQAVEDIMASRIHEVDCLPCKCAIVKLLLDVYGKKYHEQAKSIAVETLAYLKERKKDKSYMFFWPGVSVTSDASGQFKLWAQQTFGIS